MLILLIFMVIGVIANRVGIIDADTNVRFSRILLYVTQPAMILAAALDSQLELTAVELMEIFAYGFAMYFVLIALAYLSSLLFRMDAHRLKVYRFMIIFGNVAFMGFPVVSAVFGSDAVLIASIYSIPFNMLSYSVGVLMLAGGGNGGTRVNWKLMINPALIATFIAVVLVFTRPSLPYVAVRVLDSLSDMTVPGAMLVIGATLGEMNPKTVFRDGYVYLLSLIKLIVSPIVVWAVCGLFVKNEMYLGILVVLAAMPVAAITSMFTLEYGGDTDTASRGVFITTVLSVFTAPLMSWLLLM